MIPLSFADYLDALERNAKRQINESSEKQLSELTDLRNHTAQLSTMQKHLKHYKTLKYLVESFGLVLG